MKYFLLFSALLLSVLVSAQQLKTDHQNDRFDHQFVAGEKVAVYVKGKGKGYKGDYIGVSADTVIVTNRYRVQRHKGMTVADCYKNDTVHLNLSDIAKIGWVNREDKREQAKNMRKAGAAMMIAGAGAMLVGFRLINPSGKGIGLKLVLVGIFLEAAGPIMLFSSTVSDDPAVKVVGKKMRLYIG